MTINYKIQQLKGMFEIFDNDMDRYTQIIEFGKKNKGISSKDKVEKNRVYGCTSMAWIKVENKNKKFTILTDSDTFIVKGLLSILKYIIDDSSKEEIFSLDLNNILQNIGLDNSISSQRTNGFLNALEKIKKNISIHE